MLPRRALVALLALIGVGPGTLAAGTLHVPKDHKTIRAALDAAAPGDTVVVAAGTYREQVTLKPRVVLKSAGDDTKGAIGLKRAEATIIDGGGANAKGPAVVLAEGSTLDGFTVTNVGTFDQKEYDKHHAERGENLPDERGAVGAGEFPAVAVPAVTATVTNNVVRDNGRAGIGCTGAKGARNASVVAGNVAFRNMGGGIGVADGAAPVVRGNRCYTNLRGGIGNRNSAGLIVGNECHDNVRAGIGVREGATPLVLANTCYKNRRAGIGCRMKGTAPVVEGNVCYQNGMAGIGCRDAAAPVIRKNRCYENELAGIGCDGARATVAENVCYRNKQAGIGLRDGARATVLKNECYENELAGIGHWGDVEAVVEGNHVHHNKAAGIGFEACETGTATVLNNKVLENGTVAIGVHAGWTVRAAGNELARKDGLPPIVMVFKGAEADFSDNTITGSGVAGVRTEGTVRAAGNTFTCPAARKAGPPQFAVWALPGATVTLTKNTVRGWRHALVADKAAVTALDNTVSDYWQTGVRIVQPSAPPVVTGNVFRSDALHPGVTAPAGEGIVEGNRVEKPEPKK